jgi:hypothetical protein
VGAWHDHLLLPTSPFFPSRPGSFVAPVDVVSAGDLTGVQQPRRNATATEQRELRRQYAQEKENWGQKNAWGKIQGMLVVTIFKAGKYTFYLAAFPLTPALKKL